MKLDQKLVEVFIMHPDWPAMEEFIAAHFEKSADINGIDVSNPSSTVHAEVIATQKINKDLESMRATFQNIRNSAQRGKKPGYE